jgi:tetratricopeptide (TPR) repeat protein
LRLRACELWRLEGDLTQARACAREVAKGSGESATLAAHLGAVVALALGDRPRAEAEARSLVLAAPWSVGATKAVVLLRELYRERGGRPAEARGLLALAAALAQRASITIDPDHVALERELYAGLWVEAGEAALAAGNAVWAAAVLADGQRAAAGTPWADDALFVWARALREAGRAGEAVALYEQLRDGGYDWPPGGPQESEFYDRAVLELGVTLATLGRVDAALVELDSLPRRAPTSRRLDDAAFIAARLRLARGERQAMIRFVAEHPASPHVAEGRRLLEAP